MRVVVGLGNPGAEYENTRHNVGFFVLDKLNTSITNHQASITKQSQNSKFQFSKRFEAEVCDLGELKLVKPQTYMNKSGLAVAKIVSFYKIELENLWVVHDDLDIMFGEYKVDFGKGPKVHRGVNSVEEALGTPEFWRVRIGVDSRSAEMRASLPGEKVVLMKLDANERLVLDRTIGEVVVQLMGRLEPEADK